MAIVNVAALQMKCTVSPEENIEHAAEMASEAAEKGANVILPPELFQRPYFCQERRYEYYSYAETVEESLSVKAMSRVAKKYGVVIPVSFYERDGMVLYNTVAMLDTKGDVMGVYRKTHIPDDHYYQEKFYFTPGNTGFKVWKTEFGTIGVGICWDQWFPECARSMAVMGADILLYPTAIGSEPILDVDSMGHWCRTMCGHAAANVVPVIAANRIGVESVEPCEENGGQKSSLKFYGSSFISDETGLVLKQASRDREEILMHTFDTHVLYENRLSWGLFRDRRPDMYTQITK